MGFGWFENLSVVDLVVHWFANHGFGYWVWIVFPAVGFHLFGG